MTDVTALRCTRAMLIKILISYACGTLQHTHRTWIQIEPFWSIFRAVLVLILSISINTSIEQLVMHKGSTPFACRVWCANHHNIADTDSACLFLSSAWADPHRSTWAVCRSALEASTTLQTPCTAASALLFAALQLQALDVTLIDGLIARLCCKQLC